jgi:hypothetical protein
MESWRPTSRILRIVRCSSIALKSPTTTRCSPTYGLSRFPGTAAVERRHRVERRHGPDRVVDGRVDHERRVAGLTCGDERERDRHVRDRDREERQRPVHRLQRRHDEQDEQRQREQAAQHGQEDADRTEQATSSRWLHGHDDVRPRQPRDATTGQRPSSASSASLVHRPSFSFAATCGSFSAISATRT